MDSLTRKGFLSVEKDKKDRRVNHLTLNIEDKELEQTLGKMKHNFLERMTDGVTEDELTVFQQVVDEIGGQYRYPYRSSRLKKQTAVPTEEISSSGSRTAVFIFCAEFRRGGIFATASDLPAGRGKSGILPEKSSKRNRSAAAYIYWQSKQQSVSARVSVCIGK